jgi:hypothetical protein
MLLADDKKCLQIDTRLTSSIVFSGAVPGQTTGVPNLQAFQAL